MKPSYISSEEVKSVLSWPLVNNAVEAALKAVSSGNEFSQPARSFTVVGDRKGVLLNMPAYVGDYNLSPGEMNLSTLSCKLVTSFSGNSQLASPMPSILANILLFDNATGQLKTIVDGTEITSWRTASASVIASKYLYFQRLSSRQPIKLAVFGCGVQGRYHSLAFCYSFEVEELRLWNRSEGKARQLAAELEGLKPYFLNKTVKIIVCEDEASCAEDADIIVTATYASQPIVDLSIVKKDVHINAVGAGEIHHGELSQDLYDVAKVYVDHIAGAKVELKNLKAEIVGEVGEVIQKKTYPTGGITVFQSMGEHLVLLTTI